VPGTGAPLCRRGRPEQLAANDELSDRAIATPIWWYPYTSDPPAFAILLAASLGTALRNGLALVDHDVIRRSVCAGPVAAVPTATNPAAAKRAASIPLEVA
jgi:hypothetical protein